MIVDGGVSFHDALGPMMRDIDSVFQHPDNPNQGDVDEIVTSMVTSGMYRPIFVQEFSNVIIAGHHTWLACKELGAKRIPVVALEVDDMTAKRIMLADNRIPKKAKTDIGLELKLLNELTQYDSLIGTGYSPADLAAIQALSEVPLELEMDHAQWPSLCFQVHPRTKEAFMAMTDIAGGDRERFEMMMRLAGWSG